MTNAILFTESLPWPLHEVSRALRGLPWTYPSPAGVRPDAARIEVDLAVPVGSTGSVAHRATAELEAFEPGSDVCRLPLRISASRSFPTFVGAFEASDDGGDTLLTLTGDYRLPLGLVGQMSGGSGLARASLRRFFVTAVAAIKGDLRATAPVRPTPAWHEDLRDA